MKATRVMAPVSRNSGTAGDAGGAATAPVSAGEKDWLRWTKDEDYFADEPEEKPKKKSGKKNSSGDSKRKKGKITFNKMKVARGVALLCAIPASRGVLWAFDAIFSAREENSSSWTGGQNCG